MVRGRVYLFCCALALGLASPLLSSEAADGLVTRARAAAHGDRNGESARLFEEALRIDPSIRPAILREYADQLTYSGDARRAIPLFREFLAVPQPAAEQLRARLGLALALSWSDRNRESKQEYERALALDPSNEDSQRSLGRVQSWRGKQRDARARLSRFLAGHPDDTEALFLRAQANVWSGRSDLAAADLDRLLASKPAHEGARKLNEQLRRDSRPAGVVSSRRSTQSDGLRIHDTELRHEWTSHEGLRTAGASYARLDFDPPAGDDVAIDRISGTFRERWGDGFELNARPALEFVHATRGTAATELTWNAWGTWWPSDDWRFDLSSSRATLDNIRSLRAGILTTGASLSADYTPDENTRITPRLAIDRYTDGNRRTFGQLELERRVYNHPRVLAGARLTSFRFSRQLDHGYFDPSGYRSAALTLHTYGTLAGRLEYDVSGAAGVERIASEGTKPLRIGGANLSYPLTPRLRAEAGFDAFSSRQASSSGFSRRTLHAGLRALW